MAVVYESLKQLWRHSRSESSKIHILKPTLRIWIFELADRKWRHIQVRVMSWAFIYYSWSHMTHRFRIFFARFSFSCSPEAVGRSRWTKYEMTVKSKDFFLSFRFCSFYETTKMSFYDLRFRSKQFPDGSLKKYFKLLLLPSWYFWSTKF